MRPRGGWGRLKAEETEKGESRGGSRPQTLPQSKWHVHGPKATGWERQWGQGFWLRGESSSALIRFQRGHFPQTWPVQSGQAVPGPDPSGCSVWGPSSQDPPLPVGKEHTKQRRLQPLERQLLCCRLLSASSGALHTHMHTNIKDFPTLPQQQQPLKTSDAAQGKCCGRPVNRGIKATGFL